MTCFERLVEEGRRALAAGNYERATERFADGLALWRGPALGDFAYEPFAGPEIERLDEQRLAALEERIEAELALGHHSSLIGELESLSGQTSAARARPTPSSMLALYRSRASGRGAPGLPGDRRQHLLDELGINPSPTLQQLEQAILRQDPSLELPARPVAREDGRPPVEPMSPKRRLPSTRPLATGSSGGRGRWASGRRRRRRDRALHGQFQPFPRRRRRERGRHPRSENRRHQRRRDSCTAPPDQVAAGDGSIWAVNPGTDRPSLGSTPPPAML